MTLTAFGAVDGNIILASILNLAITLIFIILEKIERRIERYLIKLKEKKGQLNIGLRTLKWYLQGPSVKASIYFVYMAVIVGTVVLTVDPGTAGLQIFSEYLLSMRYGILFLIAVDKFLALIIERINKEKKVEEEVKKECEMESIEKNNAQGLAHSECESENIEPVVGNEKIN